MKRCLFLSIAGIVASLALGTPSQAATVTYDSATVTGEAIPFSTVLAVQQFNPSLGTLTGVQLSVDATVTGSVAVTNISSGALTFTNAFISVPLTSTGPDGTIASTVTMAIDAAGTAAANTTTTFPVTASSQGFANATTFSAYEGTGTFNATLAATSLSFGGTPGPGGQNNLFFGGAATAGGFVDVTYTYTPGTPVVPEPASMALLGIGMVSLLSWRRIFKRYTTA